MAVYDPVQDVIEEEGLDTPAPRAGPVFQPDTPAYDPVQDVIAEERPIFQPLHPDAQPDGDRPVFQSAHGPAEAIELPAQAAAGETHIELTRPGRPFQRTPLPLGEAPAEADQFPGAQPEAGLQTVVPRAYTPAILAARQQAEQLGGTFAQRPLAMPAVGAAAQQAQQFAQATQAPEQPILAPINAGDVALQFWNQLTGHFQETATILNQAQGPKPDQLHIQQFLDQGLPGETPEGKQLFLQQLQAMPREQRAQIIEAYIPYATAGGPPSTDAQSVMSAIDRLNDPALQAQWKAQQDQAIAEAQKKIAGDPRLAGTRLGNVISDIASIPDLAITAAVPPLFAAQLQTQIRAGLAQEHPDWSDDKLDDMAARSTIAQILPQEIGGRLLGAGVGPFIGGIRSNLGRAAAQVGVGAATQAGLAATGQLASNIAIGEPATQGVGQAAISGATMGGVAGGVHGLGELGRPAPEAAPKPKPEPTTGPSGARIRGPEAATLERGAEAATAPPEAAPVQPTQPVPAATAVAPETPTEGATDQGTIHNAVGEKTVSGTSRLEGELSSDYQTTAAGGGKLGRQFDEKTGRWKTVFNMFQRPGTVVENSDGTWSLHLDDNGSVRVFDTFANANKAWDIIKSGGENVPQRTLPALPERGTITGAQGEVQPVPEPARKGPPVLPPVQGEVHEGVAQGAGLEPEQVVPEPRVGIQQEQAGLVAPTQQTRPATGEEPWVSSIANKFVQPKVEPGAIPPGTSFSTKELIERGTRMEPEEVNQHISDIMRSGDPAKQVAAVRAEEARLDQRSAQLSQAAEALSDNDPGKAQAQLNAENAQKDWLDFHNGPVAKLKTAFHQLGQGMQGEHEIDLSTYDGMRKQWLKDLTDPETGKTKVPSRAAEEAMRRVADQVNGAQRAEAEVMNRVGQVLNSRKIMDAEEARRQIMEEMKVAPCIR